MKQHILPAIKLTILCIIMFMGVYTLVILAFGQVTTNNGNGKTVMYNNRMVGYDLEGQNFTQDKYFWSRPSAAGYNAAGSGGSNKGPSNPDYLKQVQDRIDTFQAHNPGIATSIIPSELVTASGSGLDPDLSPAAALIQVKRIAASRNVSADKIIALVNEVTEQPMLNMFGTARVNVLKLNIELDKLR